MKPISKTRVLEALNQKSWVVREAAQLLGITRTSLHRLVRAFELERPAHILKGNWHRNKTHCPQGHAYGTNPMRNGKGHRICGQCALRRERVRALTVRLLKQGLDPDKVKV